MNNSIKAIIQLLLLLLAGFILSQVSSLIVAYSYGINLEELSASGQNIMTESPVGFVKWSLFFSHLFTFILPSLAFGFLQYKDHKWEELPLSKFPTSRQLLLGILFIIVAYPAISYSYTVNSWIPLPESMMQMEDSIADTMNRVLKMDTFLQFLINLTLIGIIPAIGEELLFRGIIQKYAIKLTNNGHAGVWIASILFSGIHMQFEGFLPRLGLGLVMGYSYLWTKNLWVPIILHFLNNSIPVMGIYFAGIQMATLDPSEGPQVTWYVAIISLILTIGLGRYYKQVNKTNEYA